jgi:hypothetical protein
LSKAVSSEQAVGEPVGGDAVEDHVGFGISGGPEGVMRHARIAGGRGVVGPVLHPGFQAFERGHRRVGRTEHARDAGAETASRRGLLVLRRPVWHMKSEWSSTASDRERMIVYWSAHLAEERQVLADLEAGDVRGDGLEFAADFRRRIHSDRRCPDAAVRPGR